MKSLFRKLREYYFQTPIFTTIIFSLSTALLTTLAIALYFFITGFSVYTIAEFFLVTLFFFPLALSIILTIENILLLFTPTLKKEEERKVKHWEVFAIIVGILFSIGGLLISNITSNDWHVQLMNTLLHTPVASEHLLTIAVLASLSFISYMVLRFVPLRKLPPLFAVLCVSGLYIGMGLAIVWCIQILTPNNDIVLWLPLFPINMVVIALRTIKALIKQQVSQPIPINGKFQTLKRLLNNVANWPWLALIFTLPLLGVLISILLLFGQEPDSLIKAWTETADWTFSEKIAPPNVIEDGHYLCTVAAGGHRQIVKPLRTGKRHGHEIIVNRQLSIANAFEQLIEERLPSFHRVVRTTYDMVGYPIARHINSRFTADIIYIVMKPLEWLFLVVLYLFDPQPENRIALQYPHTVYSDFVSRQN